MGQRPQGGLVGPVQVLQQQQQRARRGRSEDAAHDAVPPREGHLCGRGLRLRRDVVRSRRSHPRASRTARHGHSGGAPSSCEQRPHATANPCSRASAARSVTSRVLPMPGSPTTCAQVKAAARGPVEQGRQHRALGLAAHGGIAVEAAVRAGGCHRASSRGRVGAGCGDDRGGQGLLDLGGLPQDRRLQGPQPGPGVDAELLDQGGPDRPQRLEGVGLPTGTDQGEGVGGPQRLVHRVAGRRGLGGGQHAGVVADRQQAQQPGLLGRGPQPLEGGPRRQDVGVVGQVGVRLPAPGREHVVEPVDRPRHLRARRPPRGRADVELRRQWRQHPAGGTHLRRRRRGRRRPRPGARST